MAQRTSDFKRGDTFALTCTYKVSGEATSATGFSIRAQLRNSHGGLVADLEATLADQSSLPGVFYLAPAISDTSGWDVGDLSCDIEIISDGVVRSTVTFVVPVLDDITK